MANANEASRWGRWIAAAGGLCDIGLRKYNLYTELQRETAVKLKQQLENGLVNYVLQWEVLRVGWTCFIFNVFVFSFRICKYLAEAPEYPYRTYLHGTCAKHVPIVMIVCSSGCSRCLFKSAQRVLFSPNWLYVFVSPPFGGTALLHSFSDTIFSRLCGTDTHTHTPIPAKWGITTFYVLHCATAAPMFSTLCWCWLNEQNVFEVLVN